MRTWTSEKTPPTASGWRPASPERGKPTPLLVEGSEQAAPRLPLLADPATIVLALAATLLGIVFVFDAGYARSLRDGKGMIPREFFLQFLFMFGAVAAGWICSRIRLARWERWAKGLWVLNLLALAAVLVPSIGHELGGASRWFRIGPITVQPAEFAKLTAVLFLGASFAHRKAWPKRVKMPKSFSMKVDSVYFPKFARFWPAVWVSLCLLLIELEPDLGTAFIVATTAFAMFWLGGVTRRSLLWCVTLAAVALLCILRWQPYRLDRIATHGDRWNPSNVDGTAYQTVQSELAMASGAIFGVGMGAGRAKHVMPAATTDFISATIGEEFGFLGWTFVTAVLGGLSWRLAVLARRATTRFGSLVLGGVSAWIGVQSVVNLMMANGTLPAIGIPLPFISSGGSSLVALWMAIGIAMAAVAAPKPTPTPAVEASLR